MENLLLQDGRRRFVFVGQDVIDSGVQGVAYVDQGGQGNFDT